MSRRNQLMLIAATVIAITSVISHATARWLKIRTQAVTPLNFGATNQPVDAVVAGSSLTFYGVDWAGVARSLETRMQGWAVPAGSVLEMEALQTTVPKARVTFLGIGASDLNENYISDFRSEIVPLQNAVSGLIAARSDWSFSRRVLSQYPLTWLRKLFPTAGRSTTVMVGIREEVRAMRRPKSAAPDPGERAVVVSDSNTHQENIGDWPQDRLMRNIGDMRSRASGEFEFDGPKRDALLRFMKRGTELGRMVVVILPESPAYQNEFVSGEVRQRFNDALAAAQSKFPDAVWVRLDQVPEIRSNDNYWDLVHLNAPGQVIATKLIKEKLAAAGIR